MSGHRCTCGQGYSGSIVITSFVAGVLFVSVVACLLSVVIAR